MRIIKRLERRYLYLQAVPTKSGFFNSLSLSLSYCLHKVSDEVNCIKVASDFLSAKAISVCKTLAGEFWSENLVCDAWKDDVLQLNFQLYCAWLSLQRPLEDSQALFVSIPESLFPPSCKAETPVSDRQHPREDAKHKSPGQPVWKKARYDPEYDKRLQFKCDLCPLAYKKTFLSYGLHGHLLICNLTTELWLLFRRDAHKLKDVDMECYTNTSLRSYVATPNI